MNEQNKDK